MEERRIITDREWRRSPARSVANTACGTSVVESEYREPRSPTESEHSDDGGLVVIEESDEDLSQYEFPAEVCIRKKPGGRKRAIIVVRKRDKSETRKPGRPPLEKIKLTSKKRILTLKKRAKKE